MFFYQIYISTVKLLLSVIALKQPVFVNLQI